MIKTIALVSPGSPKDEEGSTEGHDIMGMVEDADVDQVIGAVL